MALFRCNSCGHLREVGEEYIGKIVACPKCKTPTTIYSTTTYISSLLKHYKLAVTEINTLKKEQKQPTHPTSKETIPPILLSDIKNLSNTDKLSLEQQYTPIISWFDKLMISTSINPEAMDTTGFFDEIALRIGKNYKLLRPIINQIKYIQNKDFSTVKITLSHIAGDDKSQIISFCKELYDYSFVARYNYVKKDATIYLTLQKSPKIKAFFNGIWMEWYIFMISISFFKKLAIPVSCVRSLHVAFQSENLNELDLFFLIDATYPLWIECKSGEFRHDIDKYVRLRKRLNLTKDQAILCVFGLETSKAQGLTAMYDITIVNEIDLLKHYKKLSLSKK